MTLSDFLQLYAQNPTLRALASELNNNRRQHYLLSGISGAAQTFVYALLLQYHKKTMLIVEDDADAALYRTRDAVEAGVEAMTFPSTSRLHKRVKTDDESYLIQRTELLNRLSQNTDPLLVFTYPEALLDEVPQPDNFKQKLIHIEKGQTINEQQLQQQLLDLGFTRVDFVYEPGQYAVRGGIFDVFSYSYEQPFRLDFFGDEIDSIRVFDLETQLSENKINSADIIAAANSEKETTTLFSYLPKDTILASHNLQLLQLTDLDYCTIEFGQHCSFPSFTKFDFHTTPQPLFHKNFDLLIDSIKDFREKGYKLYLASDSQKQCDRLQTIVAERSHGDVTNAFQFISKTVHEGFVDSDLKLAVFTDHQLFERYHKVEPRQNKAKAGKVLLTLRELNTLQIGDYVVHIDHGVGRFGGLVHTEVNGRPQEMIKLIYRDNDILFVSIHSLHRIAKYRGKDMTEPTISKLGSGAWERMKERTKNKVKDIARDLIKLYAERRQEKGFAYSPDTYMQRELEASFLYEDTPDQQKATLDTKHDMESPVPMDRLICGDVGFGKTEIAMRAAFKAAADNKQTAVLVPTTVLALQHYNTFTERFKNFPIKVEYLTRAKSAKETKEILEKLKQGSIDVLIGTHKLVGKQVQFKDLGLLIIDEEQKFGVATKEKLRQLQTNVDTLTLTATPIPRTLQFSLLGARDLSVMTTPPPNRFPVQTEVLTPDDTDILKEAIRLEINRNGQVYVVSNRIQSLATIENKIRQMVPEARTVIAHGQMPPADVEEILYDFINYDYDVLICTSIIEAGVDIPNVNTIIIHSAQHFGLSDLHQLRGRVGRSNKRAYCYLVAPELELLTPEARRRLEAVETFTDLGSGFHLAMQDLDIRGAGNMLGAEQSGFIADLGYETYQKILTEAVLELKEQEFQELFEEDTKQGKTVQYVSDCQLDSDMEIGFPPEYIENISERISLYRELDGLQNEDQLLRFKKNLIDRFGVLPQGAEELLLVVRLRWLGISMGIEKLVLKNDRMILYFPQNSESPYYQSIVFGKIINYTGEHPRRCLFRENNGKRSLTILNIKSVQTAYDLLFSIRNEKLEMRN